ncbi:MAG: hypothetical protein IMZ43_12220 [Thermoplasmata archaeon]|nr:hypothetical protein [Thermoplasmata archaeon]
MKKKILTLKGLTLCPACQTPKKRENTCGVCGCPGEIKGIEVKSTEGNRGFSGLYEDKTDPEWKDNNFNWGVI